MCECNEISAYFPPIPLADGAHGVYAAAMAANTLLAMAYDPCVCWHQRLGDALPIARYINARPKQSAARHSSGDLEILESALADTKYCRIYIDEEGNIWLIHAAQIFCDSCGLPLTSNPHEWCACEIPRVDGPVDVETPQYRVEWDHIGHATIRYSWPYCVDIGDENHEKSAYIQGDDARITAAKLAIAEMETHCDCTDPQDCESARLKYYEIVESILEDYLP